MNKVYKKLGVLCRSKPGPAIIPRILILMVILSLSAGCASSITSDVDPNVELSTVTAFYVQRFEPDQRGLEKIIADDLLSRGFTATYGEAEKTDEQVDAIVTYRDKWMWDITMYMIEIAIELHDPETGYVFASGQSYHTSLARQSPPEMVGEVFDELFGVPENREE